MEDRFRNLDFVNSLKILRFEITDRQRITQVNIIFLTVFRRHINNLKKFLFNIWQDEAIIKPAFCCDYHRQDIDYILNGTNPVKKVL